MEKPPALTSLSLAFFVLYNLGKSLHIYSVFEACNILHTEAVSSIKQALLRNILDASIL
jgi:hypothetical protein